MLRAHHTYPDAHEAQLRAYRRMGPERRAEAALELSDAMRRVAREGIRGRHPADSAEDAARALVVLFYGVDVARLYGPARSRRCRERTVGVSVAADDGPG